MDHDDVVPTSDTTPGTASGTGSRTAPGAGTPSGGAGAPGGPYGELLDRLAAGLPPEALLTDPDVTVAYGRDMASFCDAGTPAVVVVPRTVEQVQHVMRTATALRVPVVPQGARTGLSGAANAADGWIVLSLTKMDRILEISPVDRIAVVEPGVVNAALARAVAAHGLTYPPDPSSWESCTIGGNIGTASGGLCCVKYGVTAEYVLGLDVVLADGRLLTTGRRTAKGVAGYDLTRLFVGSEGTLGIVVKAVLALRPKPPERLVLAAEFPSATAACEAVCAIMASGHTPSLLELMDRTTIRAVNALGNMGLPETTEALLLAAFDTPDPAADLAAVGELCAAAGATEIVPADTAAESELLLQARRSALPALESLKPATMIDDVCVPRSRLGAMMEGTAAIAEKYGLTIGVCAHAGDGNTHPVVCFDHHDPDETRRARESFDAIMALGLELGGTITGEHGVGVLKKEWLARELGPVGVELQQGIKRTFDPLGILNPGKLF
ncbi:FAD-linked oxidase C-terminal domain-containing protein [Streptomyces sp. NPDC020875]|uniref:FAD-binding oxidoreductase n=1 Tax=Streptomyces sp. NPDC020875 TaxID=3154898 RepID=UPI0033C9B9D9